MPADAQPALARRASNPELVKRVDTMPDKLLRAARPLSTPNLLDDMPSRPRPTFMQSSPPNVAPHAPTVAREGGEKSITRPLPTLPLEVLSIVAKHLPQTDQAACTVVSQDFLRAFGGALWHRRSLYDLKLDDISPLPPVRFLLGMIRVLVMKAVELFSGSLSKIGDILPLLTTVIVASSPPVLRLPNAWLMCNTIGPQRNIKVVLYAIDSTLPGGAREIVCASQEVTGVGKTWADCASDVVLYFTRPGNSYSDRCWISPGDLKPLGSAERLRSLTLIFKPLDQTSWEKRWSRSGGKGLDGGRCYINTVIPPVLPGSPLKKSLYARNFCFALAFACVHVPAGCTISIVNLDQIDTCDCQFIRSKTGDILEFPTRSRDAPARPQGARLEEATSYIDDRTQKAVDTIQRWLERLLQDEGKQEELETRLDNIQFISLKEYMEMPGRKDEWEGLPESDDWL